jgi:hypothetical protein
MANRPLFLNDPTFVINCCETIDRELIQQVVKDFNTCCEILDVDEKVEVVFTDDAGVFFSETNSLVKLKNGEYIVIRNTVQPEIEFTASRNRTTELFSRALNSAIISDDGFGDVAKVVIGF